MTRAFIFYFLFVLSQQLTLLASAGDTHLILYSDEYLAQATALQKACVDNWAIKTEIVSVSQLASRALFDGTVHRVDPIVGEDIDWTLYWSELAGAEDLLVAEPRVLLWALSGKRSGYVTPEWPTLKALTILGNSLEIPPSTITYAKVESDGTWSNIISTVGEDGVKGLGTDYYYGLEFDGKTPISMIPKVAVSRIPVYMMDPPHQQLFLTIDTSFVSNAIIRAHSTSVLAADGYKGKNLYLDVGLTEDNSNNLIFSPYYQSIKAHSATNANGYFKIVMTSMSPNGYVLKDTVNFPYIINATGVLDRTILGAFAYLNGSTLVDAYDPYAFGKSSIFVADASLLPVLNTSDSERKVEVTVMTGTNRFYLKTFTPLSYTTAAFGANVNSGVQSIILYSDVGLYAVTGYGEDAGGQYFDLSTQVGDPLPNLSTEIEAIKGARFNIFDMTSLRNSLLSLNVSTINYVLPSFFKNEDNGSSRLGTVGYIFDLSGTVDSVVEKMVGWDNYLKSKDRKMDYAHNALITGQANRGRWEYVSEHLALELLNYQDPENVTSPGLFNGYNVQKVFHSNDGYKDSTSASGNRVRSIGVPAGDFVGVGNVGTELNIASKGATLLTDSNGEAEIILKMPSSGDSAFGVSARSFFIEGENPPSNNLLRSWTIPYKVIGASASAASQIVFTSYPEVGVGETATMKFELRDANGRVVTSDSGSVDLQLLSFGINSAVFVNNGLSTMTVSLSSGKGSVDIRSTISGQVTIIANNHPIVGGPSFGYASFLNSSIELKTPWSLIWSIEEGAGDYDGLVHLRIRVVDDQFQAVKKEGRPIIFKLSAGANKKAIDSVQGKGIAVMVDWWNDLWGSTSVYFKDNFALPAKRGDHPELPMMISPGNSGFSVEYELSDIRKSYPYVPEHLFASGNAYFVDGDYRGIMGYIGRYGAGLFYINKDGYWDKGQYNPKDSRTELVTDRHLLAREALREYLTAADPSLASLWTQSVQSFLRIKALTTLDSESAKDKALVDAAMEQAASDHINILEKWGIMGMAAQKLPRHSVFATTANGLPGDVPPPQIKLISKNLRVTDTTTGTDDVVYDRYKTPVVEVPQDSSVDVTIQVTNLADVTNDLGTVVQRGLRDYDANIQFRYTLVTVPLDQPYSDISQYPARISEIDFDGFSQIGPSDNQISWTAPVTGNDNITFTFGGNWVATNGQIIERGPAIYMVKVEAQEKAHSGAQYLSQRTPNFTKEARIFFKIVNEFKVESGTQFLLVNNTDHDPYKQHNYNWSGFVSMVPNPAIRYYEDALDSYQYNKGVIASANIVSGIATLYAKTPEDMFWNSRVKSGDRIRVKDANTNIFGPWHLVKTVTPASIEVIDDRSWFADATISNSVYFIQRAYNTGYATLSYTWTNLLTAPVIGHGADRSIAITIEHGKDQGFLNVVQTGDYFKFTDGRVYHKISGVNLDSSGSSANIYRLSFDTAYPYENIYHYYSQNQNWGGVTRMTTGSGERTFSGSYSIYPADPLDSNKPSYLYQTWNVHNFVTTNEPGLGLHGDVTLKALDQFAEASADGHVHRAVIWANDVGFAEVTAPGIFRDRNNDGILESQVYDSKYPLHFLSNFDMTILDTFLAKGGRLMTGGQDVDLQSGHKFFTNTLGIFGGTSSTEAAITKVEYDLISDDLSGSVSIQDGDSEGSQLRLELEANGVNYSAQQLDYSSSIAKSFISYGNSGASTSAGIRVSGGEQLSPYAAVYYGMDFSTIYPSGIKGDGSTNDASSEGSGEGRNFLMKKTIDWLRDPTITTSAELTVSYTAEYMDGSTGTLVLQLPGEKVESLNVAGVQSTRVGPNQEITFRADGGKLYGQTDYSWQNLSSEGSLYPDPNEPNNDDMHQMIFKTGPKASFEYNLSIKGPDGSFLPLKVKTSPQQLFVIIKDIPGTVINGEMVYGSSDNVVVNVYGGDGLGTYSVDLSGDSRFVNKNNISSSGGGRTFDYSIPSNITMTSDSVSLNFLVLSGDWNATATLIIYKPLKFSNSVAATYVLGGISPTLTVSGGKPFDINGNPIGYTFSTSSAVIGLNVSTDGESVSLKDGVTTGVSENPNFPTAVSVLAQDINFVNATASREINVFAKPNLYYFALSSNTTTNTLLSEGVLTSMGTGGVFSIPGDNIMNLQLLGGSGNTSVTILSVSGGVGPTGALITYKGIDYKESDLFQVSFSSNAMVLHTGATSSSINLLLESGGSKTYVTLNFKSPVSINYAMGTGVSLPYTGKSIALKTIGYSGNSIQKSIIRLNAASGNVPFSWTRNPGTMGGFLTQAQFDTLPQAFPVIPTTSTNIIQPDVNESVYFVAGIIDGIQGNLSVTDSDGSTATILVKVTSVDQLEWVSTEATNSPLSTKTYTAVAFTFKAGSYPYTVTHSFSDSAIGVGKTLSSRSNSYTINSPDPLSFTLYIRGQTGIGRVTVTDAGLNSLSSELITVSSAAGGGVPTTSPGSSVGGISSSGGGGCLLH